MTPQSKTLKRAAAIERNEAWAALDPLTKIDRLHRRPGFSKRQRDRIMAPLTAKKRQILAERRAEVSS